MMCTLVNANELSVYGGLVYGVERHIQQYFSYIVGSVLLVEETGIPGEKPNELTVIGITQIKKKQL